MTNFSSGRALLYGLKFASTLILVVVSLIFLKSLGVYSDANAQTAQQIEMARQLGIDIKELKGGNNQEETGIGQHYEEFILDQERKRRQKHTTERPQIQS